MSEYLDVRAFNKKFGLMQHDVPGHLTKRKLRERIEFLEEELKEFKDACTVQDLAEQGDALIDLVYVAIGTAVMMGLPWEHMWQEVQRANMDKVRGETKRGHLVDCIKPPGWQPPDHARILRAFGYNPNDYTAVIDDGKNTYTETDENKCRDDAEARLKPQPKDQDNG